MEIVTFEIGKKLKEKGFDEECLAYYTSEYTLYTNKVVLCDDKYLEVAEIDYEECLRSYNTQKDRLLRTIVDAPTISQVLKWLREEKNIICLPHIEPIEEKWFFYVVRLPQTSDFPEYMSLVIYNTYEQAALAGIEYVLDNLI